MQQTDGGKAFRDILAAGTPVVFDGGMGTSLYEQVTTKFKIRANTYVTVPQQNLCIVHNACAPHFVWAELSALLLHKALKMNAWSSSSRKMLSG